MSSQVAAKKPSRYRKGVGISAEQIRAARGLLKWTQGELAEKAGISRQVLNGIELEITDPRTSSMLKIERALLKAGVVFIPENGGGAGVRRKK